MSRSNVRVAWDDVPVSYPKEPPQRHDDAVSKLVWEAQDAFKYNWRSRLNDVRPATHPKMRYDNYREDKEKLFSAVELLCATRFVDTEPAAKRVLAAFGRLRSAVHLQNSYNNEMYHGMDQIQLAGADMKALLELTVVTPKGSVLRDTLETAWLSGMTARDTENDGWKMRNEVKGELRRFIPGSDKALLCERLLRDLQDKDRETRIEHSGLRLAANEP